MTADTVSYEKVEDEGVVRTLGATILVVTTFAGLVTITNVENIIGSQGDDTLTGSDQDNVIEGGEGGDTLRSVGMVMIPCPMPVPTTGSGSRWECSTDEVTASRGHASGDTPYGLRKHHRFCF